MPVDVKDSFTEFSALSDNITDFILYVAEHIESTTNHDTMVAMIQLQIKLFTAINELTVKQDWIIEKLKEIKNNPNVAKHH